MKATLTFPSRRLARLFTYGYAHNTLKGHSMSPTQPDGTVVVELYNVTDSDRAWIDGEVEFLNSTDNRSCPAPFPIKKATA
jgi:hypothetical protein